MQKKSTKYILVLNLKYLILQKSQNHFVNILFIFEPTT